MNTSDIFINKIKKYIVDNNLLKGIKHIVTGVSGGADSICLFEVLFRLKDEFGYSMEAVHINHCIRGEEANGDEEYVKQFCTARGTICTCIKKDIPQYAKERKLTEEEAGREVRYSEFRNVLKKYDEDETVIAVAHNMNDTCETMLFNMFRGTGLKGLAGIGKKNGNIVRPLICVTRCEIEHFLEAEGIKYRTDRTNFEEEYMRNRIRLNIIPYAVDNINSKAVVHMANAAEKINDAEDFINNYTMDRFSEISKVIILENSYIIKINAEKLSIEKKIIRQRIVREAFRIVAGRLKDIEEVHVDDTLALLLRQVGKMINLPYEMIAYREYEDIVITTGSVRKQSSIENALYQKVELGKTYYIKDINKYISFSARNYQKNEIIPKNNYTKWFDYDKIYNVILLRNQCEDDYIVINPNGGKKSLKSFFKDSKISQEDRKRVPLLTDGTHVMWIIGHRTSEAYRVDDNTQTILEVTLHDADCDKTL